MVGFWKTKESDEAKVYFSGQVMAQQIVNGSGDLLVTQKGDMFKFVHGVNNTDKYPYLEYVKNINVSRFPKDTNIKIGNRTFTPLGKADIYKLKNRKYLWEY